MQFNVGCTLAYTIVEPTTFFFNIEAAQLARQMVVSETLEVSQPGDQAVRTVPDDGTRYLRLTATVGTLTVRYSASVEVDFLRADPSSIGEVAAADLPLAVFPFLLPSRFVPSDHLAAYAQREFGAIPAGYSRVTEICNWINANIEYRPGASDNETIASETLLDRAGVCRDFAHLGVAFCRSLGIPARFVSCYAAGLVPQDFHAVFEAYLGGRWWLFDPTRQAELDGLVRIGVGRDASEVSFATPIGLIEPGPIEVSATRGDVNDGERTVEAISVFP